MKPTQKLQTIIRTVNVMIIGLTSLIRRMRVESLLSEISLIPQVTSGGRVLRPQ